MTIEFKDVKLAHGSNANAAGVGTLILDNTKLIWTTSSSSFSATSQNSLEISYNDIVMNGTQLENEEVKESALFIQIAEEENEEDIPDAEQVSFVQSLNECIQKKDSVGEINEKTSETEKIEINDEESNTTYWFYFDKNAGLNHLYTLLLKLCFNFQYYYNIIVQ